MTLGKQLRKNNFDFEIAVGGSLYSTWNLLLLVQIMRNILQHYGRETSYGERRGATEETVNAMHLAAVKSLVPQEVGLRFWQQTHYSRT